MTSSHDLSAHPDGTIPPGPGPARPHRRRAAALLAAAAPLAAVLATAPAAMAVATTTAPATGSHLYAAELLTTTATLPSTTAGLGGTDPKIPALVGD